MKVIIIKGEHTGVTASVVLKKREEIGSEYLYSLMNESGIIYNGEFTYFPASFLKINNN